MKYVGEQEIQMYEIRIFTASPYRGCILAFDTKIIAKETIDCEVTDYSYNTKAKHGNYYKIGIRAGNKHLEYLYSLLFISSMQRKAINDFT